MVRGSPSRSQKSRAAETNHERSTSLEIFHSSGQHQNVPRSQKKFWWTRMKKEIAKYVVECDTCQRVKASHLKVAGTLQPLPIPSWKWEDISMDFIVGLPNTSQHHDSIWVIVDRLTKTAHFIPVHTEYRAKKYAEIYIDRIVCLHGIPKTIISDRGPQLWQGFGSNSKRLSELN